MPVCLVFAAELDGKFGIGEQRLQGAAPKAGARGRRSAAFGQRDADDRGENLKRGGLRDQSIDGIDKSALTAELFSQKNGGSWNLIYRHGLPRDRRTQPDPPMNILDPQGPIAAAEKIILIDSVAIMLAIVVPTIVAIFAFAWWFRASNTRARYLPDWAYSGRIELIVWAIPVLVIMLLGGVAWIGSHELDPAKPILASDSRRSRSRSSRSTGNGCSSIPDQRIASVNQLRSGRRAAAFLADLGERDERLLHPAARQHDLHDERHDDAAEPAGGPAGTFHGLSAISAATVFRHAFRRAGGRRRTSLPTGSGHAARAATALDAGSYADLAKQSVQGHAVHLSLADPELFQQIVDAEAAAGAGPADRTA